MSQTDAERALKARTETEDPPEPDAGEPAMRLEEIPGASESPLLLPSPHNGADAPKAVRYAQANRRLLELETRRRIYDRIQEVPGIHFRRLHRDLSIPMGTLEHHLHKLERHGLIVSHRARKKRSYFIAGNVGHLERHYLYYLRYRTSRRILLQILADPDLTVGELRARVGIRPPTLSYHLKKLTEGGLIVPSESGVGRQYVVSDPHLLRRVLETFGPTFRTLAPPGPAPVEVPS